MKNLLEEVDLATYHLKLSGGMPICRARHQTLRQLSLFPLLHALYKTSAQSLDVEG